MFITANLSLGIFISTLTSTQFQAMQMSFFTFLPQILLSGFMFPFAGMPMAAQYVAEVMPLTHFLRLVRGIMLRGAELGELMAPLRNLGIVFVVAMALAVGRGSASGSTEEPRSRMIAAALTRANKSTWSSDE